MALSLWSSERLPKSLRLGQRDIKCEGNIIFAGEIHATIVRIYRNVSCELTSEITNIDDCLSATRPTVTDGRFSFRETNYVPDRLLISFY